jgi:hypothetical protein
MRCDEPLDRLGVPESIRHFIESQIASLPDDQREVIEIASTVGMEFTAESVWSRLGPGSTVDIAVVEDRCDLLACGPGLLADAGAVEWPDGTISPRYRFANGLYREVLHDRRRGALRRAASPAGPGRSTADFGAAARRARHPERSLRGRSDPRIAAATG